jgi:hypothetical protein
MNSLFCLTVEHLMLSLLLDQVLHMQDWQNCSGKCVRDFNGWWRWTEGWSYEPGARFANTPGVGNTRLSTIDFSIHAAHLSVFTVLQSIWVGFRAKAWCVSRRIARCMACFTVQPIASRRT